MFPPFSFLLKVDLAVQEVGANERTEFPNDKQRQRFTSPDDNGGDLAKLLREYINRNEYYFKLI